MTLPAVNKRVWRLSLLPYYKQVCVGTSLCRDRKSYNNKEIVETRKIILLVVSDAYHAGANTSSFKPPIRIKHSFIDVNKVSTLIVFSTSGDLDMQLMQLKRCDGEKSNY